MLTAGYCDDVSWGGVAVGGSMVEMSNADRRSETSDVGFCTEIGIALARRPLPEKTTEASWVSECIWSWVGALLLVGAVLATGTVDADDTAAAAAVVDKTMKSTMALRLTTLECVPVPTVEQLQGTGVKGELLPMRTKRRMHDHDVTAEHHLLCYS